MLHHVSFAAENPAVTAQVLAGMLAATTIRAPSPPFPQDAWFVCLGDAHGSYLEVLPRGHVFDPQARSGLRPDDAPPVFTASHLLVSTPFSAAEIGAMAAAAGWRSETADTRLFQVFKIWVENTVLIEFLPPEMREAYVQTFGGAGVTKLDARLRRVEGAAAAGRAA
jgi:hypothetical protein